MKTLTVLFGLLLSMSFCTPAIAQSVDKPLPGAGSCWPFKDMVEYFDQQGIVLVAKWKIVAVMNVGEIPEDKQPNNTVWAYPRDSRALLAVTRNGTENDFTCITGVVENFRLNSEWATSGKKS